MARIHQKIIGLKSQPRWVVKIFVLLGAMLGGVFAFISYPVTETKAQDYYYEEAEDEYFDDEIRDDGDYLEEGDLDVDNFDKGIEEFLTKDNLNISGDLTTFEKAFQEVAYAYYMRGPKIQYNFHKAINSWFSPEKATTQDPSYLVCSAFTKNVYYELLGIKIPIYTYDLINYTTGHIGNPEVVGYGVKTGNDFIMRIYDYDNSEAGNEYIQLTGAGLTLLNKIIPYLRIGDVLTYDGHTLVVYDLIYDETGNIINAILMESGHGAGKGFVKSKNYITQIGINYGSLNNYLYHNSKENTAFEYGLLEGTVHIKKITGETNWKNIGTDSGKTNYSILRFVQENKSGEVVIKYNTGNYNDTSFLSYLNEKTKDRLKFSKLFTEKTVSEHADDVVELGSTMEYTIVVKNNSDEDYTDDLIITENISQFVTYKGYTSSKEGIDFNKDGSILTWNIGKLRSGEEVIIEYSVDVNSGNIGDVIVSTGSVGKIPSATIKNEIGKFLNEEQGINIKSSFENLNDDYNGKELIDRIYEESLGIDLNLEDLDITNLIKNTDLTSRSYTTLSVNQSNIFSQMILNKYWSTMRLRKRNYEDTEIHIYENKTWRFLSNKDRRADTINSENFRTGDILIYTNKNDKRYIYSTGAGLSITPITYEDGEYAYIYIDGKFVGVNLGSDGLSGTLDDRNEFTRKYYIDNGISWYSHGDAISGETDEFKDALQLQTLFGKDYYVILRPSLMIRNITYELSGGTNNDENPSAFILGSNIELKEPTKSGFAFKGWYTDSEYTTQVTNTNELTDDVVLYAKWENSKYELTTFEKAFQEVAYAYYMRGPYMHYNFSKGVNDILSPEESTSQDYHYMTCTPFVMNVYKELLGIVLTPHDSHYGAYARDYVGKRPEVIGYGRKSGDNLYWSYGTGITIPEECDEAGINPTSGCIIKQLKIGDILLYAGHAMLVYDYVFDENGNIVDVYLIHSRQSNYRTKTKADHGTEKYYNMSGNEINLKFGHSQWSRLGYNYHDRTGAGVYTGLSRIEGTVILEKLTQHKYLKFPWTGKNYYTILRLVDDTDGNSYLNFNGQWSGGNKFIFYNFLGLGSGSSLLYNDNNTLKDFTGLEVEYSNSVQSRLKYSKLYIEKTVDKKDNNIVEPEDELTYKIVIKNESKEDYETGLIVKENIDTNLVEYSGYSYTRSGTSTSTVQLIKTGEWNIGILNSKDEVIIQYTVRVKTGHIGETIESTGLVDNIPSGIVKNKIGKNTNKGEELKQSFNNLSGGDYTGRALINEIYMDVYGVDLGLNNLRITGKTTGLILYNGYGDAGYSNTYHAEMKINTGNQFSGMVLNSYFNVLRQSGFVAIDGNITLYEVPPLWPYKNPDNRANTIYPTDFKTGDILIYKNINDVKYSGYVDSGGNKRTRITTITYESGEYAYIYIDGKFVGVNLGNDLGNDLTGTRDNRDEFTSKYYDDNSRSWYSTGKMFGTDFVTPVSQIDLPGGFENWLQYQTLFGKDYYVILRPSLMIRDITYELSGGTNNEDNPNVFILGRDIELKEPTRTGYVFSGWYTDSEYTNQVYNTNELTDDVVLYAKWENASCIFNGSEINHGESVTGYRTNSVAYGETCESETRICTNGTLNGSYGYASCVVGEPETCIFNGSTINHGESVIGYRTNSVGYGETCESETRICENGTLNGSYGYASCTVGEPASCTFNGSTINHGESVIGYRTNSVGYGETCESEIRICENGTLNGSYGYASCVVGEPETCIFNGSEINHGESVTGYRTNSVAYGETCESETRICENGTLNGSYGYASCVVGEPATCIFNGSEINHGESVTGYRTNSVGYGETCESETRICENGTLNGSYGYASCTVGEPETCIFNGSEINHGESVTGYRTNSVGYGETCESETRICINGKLSGTYGYSSCLVQSAGGVGGVSLRKDHCPNGDYSDSYYDGTCGTNTKDSSAKPQNDKMRHNSADKVVYDTLRFNPYYSDEMNRAYQFAYHYGITTKNNIKDADMDGKLTRIAMAKMLSQYAINVLGKQPDITRQNKFADVSNKLDSDYDNGVTLAYQLGIMGINMKDNKFRPYDTVSRAEFVTALSRLLYGIEDGKDKYYITHMNLLEYLGIITNTNPTMKELRGYVMIMLMRSGK